MSDAEKSEKENEETSAEPQSSFETILPSDSGDSLPPLSTPDLSTLAPNRSPEIPEASGGQMQIGPYRILKNIGEGGMGTVYLAEQDEPIRRQVALKVIKASHHSAEVVTRFEAERQALAMMDHQHIAKVLDAGTVDNGSPYFAMELVNGPTFNEYCDQNKLSIAERLELFIPVCNAVQHAHQKGVIHRDLKPSNVLVAILDGKPLPKVIDFGLAKPMDLHVKLADKTIQTEFGRVVGTLQYMSPEQAEANSQDVDTRTDVYSLGVMLYELLTGSTPLESKTMGQKVLWEVLELIRDSTPPSPSHRLSSSHDALAGASNQRRIEPKKLQRILRGELDWIVMKAIEKDRDRRYESANGLAADIARFLNDEPVEAKPPSQIYRVQKFVRKNRGLVAAVAAMFFLLAIGVAGTTWFGIKARVAEIEARTSAKRAEGVAKIVTSSFRCADPEQGATFQMSAKDVLVNARIALNSSDLDDLGKADLLTALTSSFIGVGEYGSAVETAEEYFSIKNSSFGSRHPDTLDAVYNLAMSYDEVGRFKEALELKEKNLALRSSKLGANHPDTLSSMHSLAISYSNNGRIDEALALFEKTLKLQSNSLGPGHPATLETRNSLANSLGDNGQVEDAIKLREENLDLVSTSHSSDHPSTLRAMQNLAVSYHQLGRYEDAIKLEEKTLAFRKTKLGADHPDTLVSMNNLASSYAQAGRTLDALAIREEVAELAKRKLGSKHPTTLRTIHNLAVSYRESGQVEAAIENFELVLDIRKKVLGDTHPATLSTLVGLANAYDQSGRNDEALEIREQILNCRMEMLGPDHPDTLRAIVYLAVSYSGKGRFEEALQMFEKNFELVTRKLGPDHPDTLKAMSNLAIGYRNVGRDTDSLALKKKALELQKNKFGVDHPDTQTSMGNLINSYIEFEKYDKALELAKVVYQSRLKSEKGDKADPSVQAAFRQVDSLVYDIINQARRKAVASEFERARELLDLAVRDSQIAQTHSIALNFLVLLQMVEKDFESALATIKLWETYLLQHPGETENETAEMLVSKSVCFVELGRFDEAETSARLALKADGGHALQRSRCESVLAICLAHQKQFSDSKKKIAEAFVGFRSEIETMPVDLLWQNRRLIHRGIKICELADDPTGVAEWERKLASVEAIVERRISSQKQKQADGNQ